LAKPELVCTVDFVHELDPRDDEITGLDRLLEARSHEPSRSRALDLPSASRAGTLTNLELRDVPTDPGYCAAWLKNEAALAEAGIDGPRPRLLYVGKAVGGLRQRLRRHINGGLPGLPSILAARGVVLFAFGIGTSAT
jgi:hypothetical protein